ncbi:MAG: hypothetical protein Rpha_0282 [Candidatus Ruthia sp. Apha_13_S6]|nr:hypothetical protein [Candidatus Ruthia sp. Apha_13_S6]
MPPCLGLNFFVSTLNQMGNFFNKILVALTLIKITQVLFFDRLPLY